MPRNPFARRLALLKKQHPGWVSIYLHPDGRATVVHRRSSWRREKLSKRSKRLEMKLVHEFRWTVYAKNGLIVQASTEGYSRHKQCLKNASLPPALPVNPELNNGVWIDRV